MLRKRAVLLAVALSLLFFTAPLAVHAQAVSTGMVTGTITDPAGAVIAGADFTPTDVSTRAVRELVSNADGHYIFVNIPPGRYDLGVSKAGFSTANSCTTHSWSTSRRTTSLSTVSPDICRAAGRFRRS